MYFDPQTLKPGMYTCLWVAF